MYDVLEVRIGDDLYATPTRRQSHAEAHHGMYIAVAAEGGDDELSHARAGYRMQDAGGRGFNPSILHLASSILFRETLALAHPKVVS
jgi:hypothetical protein